MEKVIIIGAGLIGANLAYALSRQGAEVTVVEAALPAGAASGRSFGWINASFSLSEAHFALRVAGMEAHERLAERFGALYHPTGCLWWEETGAAFDQTAQRLAQAGYPLDRLSRAEVALREPSLCDLPEEALFFSTEAWVDAADLSAALLAASGARVLTGVTARVATRGGRVTGVQTDLGPLLADQVVVAAGTGAPALLRPLGLVLPMLHRPGLLVRTAPVGTRLAHILAAPEQEIRQDTAGRLLAPAAAFHQSDTGESLQDPLGQAAQTLGRIKAMLGLDELRVESVTHAERPVPGDGLPAVGAVDGVEGLWLATLHSGVTLSAIVAEGLAAEMRGDGILPALAPFRPSRLITTV